MDPEYQKYNDLVKTLYAETKVQEEIKQEGVKSEEPQNNAETSI